MKTKQTTRIKTILGISLMSLFSQSVFADDSITTTLGDDSAYTLELNSTAKDILGYQTIAKYLIADDGSITTSYYNVNIKNIGTTSSYSEIYYWDVNGELTTTDTGNLAFTAYYDDSTKNSRKTNSSGSTITETITGDFVEDSTDSSDTYGGAIHNEGTIGSIKSNFFENTATNNGGAIYNKNATITSITGDFIFNSAQASGGAICNAGTYDETTSTTTISTIGTITGNFIGNSATNNQGGAIFTKYGEIGTITGDFIGNSSGTGGGAIYSQYSTIETIKGDFIGNSSAGGAIFNHTDSSIGTITGDFINNTSTDYAGAICNTAEIGTITGDFTNNTAQTYGGAIYNLSSSAIITAITGDFIGNSAGTAGGAIWNDGTITILASSDDVNFTGNYVGTGDFLTYNAIYNYSATDSTTESTVNFTAENNYNIVINDTIDGGTDNVASQILTINTDSSSVVEFNNTVANQTITVSTGTLKMGSYSGDDFSASASLDNSTLTVAGGATLKLSSDVLLSNSSTISMGDNAVLVIDENSSLVIDLGDLELDATFTYSFMEFTDTEDMSVVLATLKEEGNFDVSVNDSSLSTTWTITESISTENGNWLVVTGTVIPEPSTYAMIFGLLSLGFVYYRKRK